MQARRKPSTAFAECESLETVSVGASVNTIAEGAFTGCGSATESGSTSVKFSGDAPSDVAEDAFNGTTATITCPADNDTWDDADFGDNVTIQPQPSVGDPDDKDPDEDKDPDGDGDEDTDGDNTGTSSLKDFFKNLLDKIFNKKDDPEETEPSVPDETEPSIPDETEPSVPDETEPSVPSTPIKPSTPNLGNAIANILNKIFGIRPY